MASGGGSKSQIVGYRYHMAMHMGLCRGPVDEIIQINVENLVAWQGSFGGNISFQISQPGLFGGDKREGGLEGYCTFLMGAKTQVCDTTFLSFVDGVAAGPYGYVYKTMSELLPSPHPEFRNVATVMYQGTLCSNNPYPKPWSFRVRRSLAGWQNNFVWYSSKCQIVFPDKPVVGMNPAHILYECLTNSVWGRGISADLIDDAAWRAAADILHAENFGLCLVWNRQTDIDEFVQKVIQHIKGAIYVDRTTGLFTLKLIRFDYDVNSIPLFTFDSGLLALEADDTAADDTGATEIRVKYRDPVENKQRTIPIRNLAAIQSSDGVVSKDIEYEGIPTEWLAVYAGQWDLSLEVLQKKFTCKMDRRARKLNPGGVFRLSVPDRGIDSVVLRIYDVTDSDIGDGTITLVCLQDVFGAAFLRVNTDQPSGWVPPAKTALPPPNVDVGEVNYRDLAIRLSAADLDYVEPGAGYIASLAEAPNGLSLSYDLFGRASAETNYREIAGGPFCNTGLSTVAVGAYDTTIQVDRRLRIAVPRIAKFGDELVNVTAYNETTGALTVERGVVDTIPSPKAVGTRIWDYDTGLTYSMVAYTLTDLVRLRHLTETTSNRLNINAAATYQVTIQARHNKPYPPGNVRVMGNTGSGAPVNAGFADAGTTLAGDVTITWNHRDRLIQADQAVAHQTGNIGPEPGTTYRVRLYEGSTLRREVTGIAGTSFTYTTAMAIADGYVGPNLRVRLESQRDGVSSWQGYDFSLNYTVGAGFDRRFNQTFNR